MKKGNSKAGRGGQHETSPGKSVQKYKPNGLPEKQRNTGSHRKLTGPLPAVKRRAIEKGRRKK